MNPVVRAVGLAVGGSLGGVAYLGGANPLSALGVGLVAALTGVLTVRYLEYVPKSDDWAVTRWNGAFVGSTMLGIFLGLNNALDVSPETTLTLQVLALALAWNGLLFGVVMVHEDRDLDSA